MNRINKLFKDKGKDILSVYYTAGFPNLNDTITVAQSLQQSGADMLEIGIPFSDPIADGPTIQASNNQALKNGMTLSKLFEQLQDLRKSVTIPVILMGYINPILQYGIEDFCKACEQVGVDGLILPDLPMIEYQTKYKALFEQHGLRNVFLISPQTSESRIKEIDQQTDAFIYMVSTSGTTGARDKFSDEAVNYFERIGNMNLTNPRLIGFGISNHITFEQACKSASGAIIGSAFIKTLEKSHDLKTDINEFLKTIKKEGIPASNY
ncbi:tryptophan synthase subunit alpha [Fulvivirga lutea]|uniref:Tryptophan synthase alpha chain n=1 Tax=Fulvivirga lutea TaxID=2810512 RepID=A0A974ZZF8_9BACT|nr:tryptophan synthase subunit alpha [Fulvivirga lutea]QSE96159.1 tryptophan synthase subunit alpha [Fulvivirga lutea]